MAASDPPEPPEEKHDAPPERRVREQGE
jgi:hypothetical protein